MKFIFYPLILLFLINNQTRSQSIDEVDISGLAFRSVGPALTTGRISDFAVNPDNRFEYYVAVSSGGVWKTTNAGTSYTPIFDSQGSYSIGVVTLNPHNPNEVWVGTGENNNQRSVAYGDGVYRSKDGGKSWKHMGLKNSEHISKIIIHPNDPNTIFVAAVGPLWSSGGDRGVYQSTDGGENWTQVLTLDEHTGVADMVMHPKNPNILFAAAHQRRRHVFTYISGGPSSAIYKSTDGGITWNKVSKGLPGVDLGRIGLAIPATRPNTVYAIVEAAMGKGGFFRSDDIGESWKKTSNYVTSGNYYQEIVTHPTDPNTIFSMNTFMNVSYDGGYTFSEIGEPAKHVDNHAMWIDPENTNYFLVGCDGGIYESFDAGKTWNFHSNMPIVQFYKVAVDNDEPFYNIYGGTQDNFSLGGPSRTNTSHGITNADWFVTKGGDGFESQVDPKNPDIVYAQSQYGVLARYDRKTGEQTGIQPKPGKDENAYRWNWDAPLAVSKHADGRIYFAANKLFKSDNRGDSWETISPDLTQQLDRNKLSVMGRTWSVDATFKHGSTSQYGTIVAFDESPLDENLLVVGTDDGLIQITTDGGTNWTKVSNFSGVPERTYVNSVVASRHDRNTIYAAFNNHKNGDFKPYLMVSKNMGKSWNSLSDDLPERGSVYAIAEDPIDPKLLFTGTEFGVFFTNDQGKKWKQIKAGLPTVAVRDIAIQERENDLVLATFGRSFYVLDDYSALRELNPTVLANAGYFFPTRRAWLYAEKQPYGSYGTKSFMGENFFTSPNPPYGATFTYYIKDSAITMEQLRRAQEKKIKKEGGNVSTPDYDTYKAEQQEEAPFLLFTIKDSDGKVVRTLKQSVKKGVNRITWDLRYPAKEAVSLRKSDPENAYSNDPEGPLAGPGDYTVSMAVFHKDNFTTLTEPHVFKVEKLFEGTLPEENQQAIAAFREEIEKTIGEFDAMNKAMSDEKSRLRYIEQAVFATDNKSQELFQRYVSLKRDLKDISTEINGDGIKSKLDLDTRYPLSQRLGYLSWEIGSTTGKPTETHKEALKIAQEEMADVKTKIESYQQSRASLELELKDLGAPYTPGRVLENDF